MTGKHFGYGSGGMGERNSAGVRISRVVTGSPADQLGIRPNSVLLNINGQSPADIIDYIFLQSDEVLSLTVRQDGEFREFRLEKEYDADLGIELDWGPGALKQCRNKCIFCFIDQLPPGMRSTLYIKDDDYRYSALTGNFITLTNLSEIEMDRITGLHLSPLHISVHTTNPDLRKTMMGNPAAAEINAALSRLAAAGILMHYQIVLCPGYNDGIELERTVHDLAEKWPQGRSVGIVPVGLTGYREGLTDLRPIDAAGALALIRRVECWQREFRQRLGYPFVFAADEFYCLAGKEVPPAGKYGGFPQLENGIGLLRLLLDNTTKQSKKIKSGFASSRTITFVTGISSEPYIRRIAAQFSAIDGLAISVAAVPNNYFGGKITVSGLLTGHDILSALKGRYLGDAVFISGAACNAETGLFLDGMTVEAVSAALGTEVRIVDELGRDLQTAISAVRPHGR